MARILKRGKIWYMDVHCKGKRIRRSLNTQSKRIAELVSRAKFDEIISESVWINNHSILQRLYP